MKRLRDLSIGNLKADPIENLVQRVIEEDIPALNTARNITLGELVSRYADPLSEKAFEKEDYQMYLLNTHLESMTVTNHLKAER